MLSSRLPHKLPIRSKEILLQKKGGGNSLGRIRRRPMGDSSDRSCDGNDLSRLDTVQLSALRDAFLIRHNCCFTSNACQCSWLIRIVCMEKVAIIAMVETHH